MPPQIPAEIRLIRYKFPPWCRVFIKALRATGNITVSALKAGTNRKYVYEYADAWPRFKQMIADAKAQHADLVFYEIDRRGRQGIDSPVVYQGQIMREWVDASGMPIPADQDPHAIPGAKLVPVTIKEYSDSLLLAEARSLISSFREKSEPPQQTTVNVGVQVNVAGGLTMEQFKQLPPEEKARLLRG